jgi:hypothetical protein
MGIFSSSPYRASPKEETSAPPPKQLSNRLDKEFHDVVATFSFNEGREFVLSFKHDEVPPAWEAGGAFLIDASVDTVPSGQRSGEEHLRSFVSAARNDGFFYFCDGAKDDDKDAAHFVPWEAFTYCRVQKVGSRKKVSITWDWKSNHRGADDA